MAQMGNAGDALVWYDTLELAAAVPMVQDHSEAGPNSLKNPSKAAFSCQLNAVVVLQSVLAVYQVASRTPPRASLLVELEPVTSAEVR